MEYFDLLAEKANPNPKKFWLVLRIGEDNPETAEQLSNGILHGLKGVSASREIVGDFLHTSGNACLVMDPKKVLDMNDIEMVDYHDHDSLMDNNMRIIRRIYNQASNSQGAVRIIQNIMRSFDRYLKGINHPDAPSFIYYNMSDHVPYLYDDRDISSTNDLVDFIAWAIPKYLDEKNLSDMEISPDVILSATKYGISNGASLYEGESEWIVNGEDFYIPAKSALLIMRNDAVVDRYEEWVAGDYKPLGYTEWRFRAYQTILDQIEKYDLRQRYEIRFISEERFASIIDKTKARRRDRKRGY